MIAAGGLVVDLGGHRALSGVDLVARTGRVTGIVGPNGSGKSTLVRCLIGAHRPTAGSVRLDGIDLRSRPRRWIADRTAFVGQRVDPDPAMRVADEVALGAQRIRSVGRAGRGHGSAAIDQRVAAALDVVDLLPLAQRRLAELSGGELQRVALARAIAHGADHAVLDEPTNHLDIRHRLEIGALLRRIAPTVVVVLHDLELAAQVCDDILVLDAGRVAAAGPAATTLTPDILDPVYRVRTRILHTPDGDTSLVFRLPTERTPSP